jgi:hypothetical protein
MAQNVLALSHRRETRGRCGRGVQGRRLHRFVALKFFHLMRSGIRSPSRVVNARPKRLPVCTYFHNSNDLEGGLNRLTARPEYLYLLEFHPSNLKQHGRYHQLKVKVNRRGVKIQARRGYFIPKTAQASK